MRLRADQSAKIKDAIGAAWTAPKQIYPDTAALTRTVDEFLRSDEC